MDKPQSLTMREYLVRILAVKLLKSEKVIDAVIVHQFSEANAALHNNDTVEISGFGKFYFNQKKAKKKLQKYLDMKAAYEAMLQNPEISEQKKKSTQVRLTNLNASIETLKPRIHE
jgi:hypothetical protein